jgi:hypothetical protein
MSEKKTVKLRLFGAVNRKLVKGGTRHDPVAAIIKERPCGSPYDQVLLTLVDPSTTRFQRHNILQGLLFDTVKLFVNSVADATSVARRFPAPILEKPKFRPSLVSIGIFKNNGSDSGFHFKMFPGTESFTREFEVAARKVVMSQRHSHDGTRFIVWYDPKTREHLVTPA